MLCELLHSGAEAGAATAGHTCRTAEQGLVTLLIVLQKQFGDGLVCLQGLGQCGNASVANLAVGQFQSCDGPIGLQSTGDLLGTFVADILMEALKTSIFRIFGR